MLNKGVPPDNIFNLERIMESDMGIIHRENGTNGLGHDMTPDWLLFPVALRWAQVTHSLASEIQHDFCKHNLRL